MGKEINCSNSHLNLAVMKTQLFSIKTCSCIVLSSPWRALIVFSFQKTKKGKGELPPFTVRWTTLMEYYYMNKTKGSHLDCRFTTFKLSTVYVPRDAFMLWPRWDSLLTLIWKYRDLHLTKSSSQWKANSKLSCLKEITVFPLSY